MWSILFVVVEHGNRPSLRRWGNGRDDSTCSDGLMRHCESPLDVEADSEIRRKDFEEAVDTAGVASTTRPARNSAFSTAW